MTACRSLSVTLTMVGELRCRSLSVTRKPETGKQVLGKTSGGPPSGVRPSVTAVIRPFLSVNERFDPVSRPLVRGFAVCLLGMVSNALLTILSTPHGWPLAGLHYVTVSDEGVSHNG